jgi:hypothetical protein
MKIQYKIWGIMIGVIPVFYGCNKLYLDDKFTIQRENYIGNELRLDGYYYQQENNHTYVEFLYRNGVILSAHSYSTNDLNIVEKKNDCFVRQPTKR